MFVLFTREIMAVVDTELDTRNHLSSWLGSGFMSVTNARAKVWVRAVVVLMYGCEPFFLFSATSRGLNPAGSGAFSRPHLLNEPMNAQAIRDTIKEKIATALKDQPRRLSSPLHPCVLCFRRIPQ